MYRVVLIDDEEIIVKGLSRVIRWENYGCEVAGTANDGKSGADTIRALKPDIVFMDICMPGVDGLKMLAGLRSEFPDMQVTVLTGFRDFSYAQEAVRLGVTRLLLKPSKMSEIDEALRAMTEKLGEKQSVSKDPDQEPAADEKPESAGNFIVTGAVNFIREHYREKLTLQTVADSCYVSQWHLSKLLSKHVGKNFYDILNEVRIAEAKRLLKDSSLRIGNIGEMVGYNDSAHFARTFKKLTGQSAAEYRNGIVSYEN